MEAAFITAIVFGGIVLSLVVIGTTFLLAIKLIRGGLSRKQQRQDAEEAKTIQEMYQQVTRMEERVDALETVLLDGKKENHPS